MHHYTVQLLGRWSRVHIGNIIRPLNFSEAAEGSSIQGVGGRISQIDTHKLDISMYIERTMSYYYTITV